MSEKGLLSNSNTSNLNSIAGNNDRVRHLLATGKPVAVWEVAAQLENSDPKQIASFLDELAVKGVSATFRAGLNSYYASPRVALIGTGPSPGTVISDSVKNLLWRLRHAVIGKLVKEAE